MRIIQNSFTSEEQLSAGEIMLFGRPVSSLEDLNEACFRERDFITGGDAGFFIDTDRELEYKDEDTFYALRSGAISDGGVSFIERKLTFLTETDIINQKHDDNDIMKLVILQQGIQVLSKLYDKL